MSKDYDIKKERVARKLESFLNGKDATKINQLSLDEIESFILKNFKTINRSSYYTNMKALNEILKENESDIIVNSKEYVDDCVKTKDEQYFTKKEVQEICKVLLNYQDKFIIYALWNGIMGKEYQDLLNIKISDIADDYSYIMINGKKFTCDDFMKNIIEKTIKQKSYYKFVRSHDLRSSDEYDFNEYSEYLIKVKPTKLNNGGLDPMKPSGLQRKLTKLQNIYFEACEEELILNGLSLVKSGIMFEMFIQEVESSRIWNIESIDNYLKMNGFRINANELYRAYHNRYHGSNVVVF